VNFRSGLVLVGGVGGSVQPALGLSKKILSFDFVICLLFMKNVMYNTKIFTENLEAKELNKLML